MRAILPGLVVSLAALGCGAPPAEPTKAPEAAPKPRPAPTPRPTARATTKAEAKAEAPRPHAEPPAPAPSFKADWLAAQDILDKRAETWEGATEKAKRALTRDEWDEVKVVLRQLKRDPAKMSSREAAELTRLGMGEAARFYSSQAARQDKQFLDVARTVWHPKMGAERLADLAERWRLVDDVWRPVAARAVLASTPAAAMNAETRNCLIDLGLRDWLTR